jgi:hypothetical protein
MLALRLFHENFRHNGCRVWALCFRRFAGAHPQCVVYADNYVVKP